MKITAAEFLKTLFKPTEQQVYVCSFPNERDDPTQATERHVITRVGAQIEQFISKWDKPGRGAFFCLGTVKAGGKRNKENIVESIGLFADLDFNKIDLLPSDPTAARDEVLKQISRLKYQPTATVFSGGGIHAYWLFKEPFETQGPEGGPSNIERIEAALRQLADLVAGDLPVCEVSRVLRIPGSHNSKNGAWSEVEVISLNDALRYELDDLEEWLSEASPVMLRKERERGQTIGEQNEEDFFAQYARKYGIKPPIDVKARLDAMMFMGSGDSSIHQTQLAVSASLLNQGTPIDDVVAILTDATRAAAGDYGKRWNWRREERNIRRICDDWIKKHPPEKKKKPDAKPEAIKTDAPAATKPKLETIEGGKSDAASSTTAAQDDDDDDDSKQAVGDNVVPMREREAIIRKGEEHIHVGRSVLYAMAKKGQALIGTKDGLRFYDNGIWELRNTSDTWLIVRIEQAIRSLGYMNSTKLRNEARNWLIANPETWREDEIPWDQHGKVPTRSGLVDPVTGELEPSSPEHYCTWRIELDYNPKADCPWWETMVSDVFGDKDKEEQIALARVVQECFGAALIDKKPRQLSKALIFWGISNQGKSGLLEVGSSLFGDSPIAAGIGSLESTHGMMPFTRRAPWILHEAFGGQWHFSSTVKAIITQEPVPINIKNGPVITQVIRAPIFWATNHQPQFKEATRAIVNRMIVIECSRVFDDKKPIGIAIEAKRRKLAKPSDVVIGSEMSGVLNWALAGLRRALERGTIETTASIDETSEAIRRDSNLVAGFLEECVGFDSKARVRVSDFCLAHSAWWMEMKGEDRKLPTNEAISKALKAVGDPRIGLDMKEMRDTHSRYYCGVSLNRAGLRYHRTGFESALFQGKIATATAPDREVNGLIPASWDNRKSVIAMRAFHNDSAERDGDDDA